jgi:hypothetical protein
LLVSQLEKIYDVVEIKACP